MSLMGFVSERRTTENNKLHLSFTQRHKEFTLIVVPDEKRPLCLSS